METEIRRLRSELATKQKEYDQLTREWGWYYRRGNHLSEELDRFDCRESCDQTPETQWDYWIERYESRSYAVYYRDGSVLILDDVPEKPAGYVRGRVGEYPPAEIIENLIDTGFTGLKLPRFPLDEHDRRIRQTIRDELPIVSAKQAELRSLVDSIEQESREMATRIRNMENEWLPSQPLAVQWPVVVSRMADSGYHVYMGRYIAPGLDNTDRIEIVSWPELTEDERDDYTDYWDRQLPGQIPDDSVIETVIAEYHKLRSEIRVR